MLTSCEDWEWIDGNIVPAYLRRRSKRGLKEGAARTRYLTNSEELITVAGCVAGRASGNHSGDRYRITPRGTFSLRWNQIDVERGIIITTTKTKSGRARSVPLPERSRGILPHRAVPTIMC